MRPPLRLVRALSLLFAVVLTATLLILDTSPTAYADTGTNPMPDSASLGMGVGSDMVSVNAQTADDLVSSSYSLADVDPMTGDIGGQSVSDVSATDYSVVADLSSNDQLSLNAAALAKQAQALADAKRAAASQAQAGNGPSQTQIGPDGCPLRVPSGTLRDGAASKGAYQLCSDAVAQAATPEAAKAIQWAFRMLGATYACGGAGRQDPFRADCSSLVARAYHTGAGLSGVSPNISTRNIMPWDGVSLAPWALYVAPADAKPGDLVVYRSCTSSPCAYQHVVMLIADGFQLETNSCGDVAHVSHFKGWGGNFVVARRVDPSKAR